MVVKGFFDLLLVVKGSFDLLLVVKGSFDLLLLVKGSRSVPLAVTPRTPCGVHSTLREPLLYSNIPFANVVSIVTKQSVCDRDRDRLVAECLY